METGVGRQRGWARYAVELGSVMVLYAVLLAALLVFLNHQPHSPWRFLLAALPGVALLGVPAVYLRQLRRTDELERLMQLQALGVAFWLSAVVSFSYWLLELVGAPPLPGWCMWVLMLGLWGICTGIVRLRYR